MAASERSAFRVMCLMWGKEIALKKCREFGIKVSEEELREQDESEKRLKKATAAIFRPADNNGNEKETGEATETDGGEHESR